MSIQNWPTLEERFFYKRRFIGTSQMGTREVWFSMGNYINFNGGRNNIHKHSYYEVCIVLEGEGVFIHGPDRYNLKKGDLFIADPGVYHEIISDEYKFLHIHFISFSFETFEKSSKAEDNSVDETINLYDTCIENFLKNHATYRENCDSVIQTFALGVSAAAVSNYVEWYLKNENLCRYIALDCMLYAIPGQLEEKSIKKDLRLDLAVRFMMDNAKNNLSIREIAAYAGTSERTLRRLMQSYYTMSTKQKYKEIRLQEASNYMLAHPEKRISEICYMFHFENTSNFSLAFKKVHGLSPKEFRNLKGTKFL